jgi:hypothetical protein
VNRFAQLNRRRYSGSVASTRTVSTARCEFASSAAAGWLDLCGSTPITITEQHSFLEKWEKGRGRHSDFRLVTRTPLLSQTAAGAVPGHKPPANQPGTGGRNLTSEPGTTPPADYDQ